MQKKKIVLETSTHTYSTRQTKIKIGVGWVKKKTNEYINDVEKITIYNI